MIMRCCCAEACDIMVAATFAINGHGIPPVAAWTQAAHPFALWNMLLFQKWLNVRSEFCGKFG